MLYNMCGFLGVLRLKGELEWFGHENSPNNAIYTIWVARFIKECGRSKTLVWTYPTHVCIFTMQKVTAMASNHNQDVLNDDLGDVNPFVGKSAHHQIHIWHEINAKRDFAPYGKLTVEKALSFINNETVLPKMSIVKVNDKKVQSFISKFKWVVSLDGMYWPVTLTRLVVPTAIVQSVDGYIARYRLSKYKDLVWYLVARMQIFYTQRIAFGGVGDKKHTDAIYKSRENYVAIQRLIQYVLEGRAYEKKYPLTLTIRQKGHLPHTIKDRWVLMFLFEGFIKTFLTENGRLIPNWKEKILGFEASHAIKDSLEYIHRNFSIAYMEFLKRQHIVTGDKITAAYLNPVVELLNLSQYPFIKGGDEVTPKHIKSVLKTANYLLPAE